MRSVKMTKEFVFVVLQNILARIQFFNTSDNSANYLK